MAEVGESATMIESEVSKKKIEVQLKRLLHYSSKYKVYGYTTILEYKAYMIYNEKHTT